MKNLIIDLKSRTPEYFRSLDHLRKILGRDVLLLGWPIGKKGVPRKWGHLTVADMTPAYIKKLSGLNIGVALGKKSGDLIALDVDDETLLEPFLSCNPNFENTLITHGARGAVFWFRMIGEYPNATKVLKTAPKIEVGEFRSDGGQAIIRGFHPDTGNQYRVLNMAKPLAIEFSKINWPAEIINPPTVDRTERLVTDDTKETDETHAIVARAVVCPIAPLSLSVRSVSSVSDVSDYSTLSSSAAVDLAMPDKPSQNNDCLFTLARAVLRIESNEGDKRFTPARLREIFGLWYQQAKPYLRAEQSRDDYMIQFMNAYKSAKIPLGADGVDIAWRNAQKNPLPVEALEYFEDSDKRLLVALCRELQIIHGEQPFFISCRKVSEIFNLGSPNTGNNWLGALCALGIIKLVKKGVRPFATRYRFQFNNAPICEN